MSPVSRSILAIVCSVFVASVLGVLVFTSGESDSEPAPYVDASPHVVAPDGFEELPDLPIDFARDGTQVATFDWPGVGVCVVVGERIGLKNPVIALDVECVEMMR